MNCIDLMVEEHKNIKRMLSVIRRYCGRILDGESVSYDDFVKIIDFVRNYADKHHHGKEEVFLFAKMIEELGPLAKNLITNGMNVEHDLGRLYMQDLEDAVKRVLNGDMGARLDVIANAVSYTHLLQRHIEKEDNGVYKYAEKNLKPNTKEQLDQACMRFEREAEEEKRQVKYLTLLEELESRL